MSIELELFADEAAYYDDDARRERSRELDFGVWWYDAAGGTYRVSYVEATGELVAVALRGGASYEAPGLRVVLGGKAGSVRVLARGLDEAEAERTLAGWAEVCGSADSLAWVLRRLEARE